MFGANKGKSAAGDLDGAKLRIGIVQARFNVGVTDIMHKACRQELLDLGVAEGAIAHHTVAGALEVPTVLQALARTGEFDALIALGCVIRGDTYHFELVCNESAAGVTRVGLDNHMPIANAILTVEDMDQAIVRQFDKAKEAARVAVEMANLLDKLAK